MKSHAKIVLLAACLMSALSLSAQTLISDFSSATGWSASIQPVGTGASLNISGGSVSLVTTSPSDSDFVVRGYTGVVGSYTSNWSVQLDVNYAAPGTLFDSGVQQFINLGLLVVKTGVTPGVSSNLPTFDGLEVASNLYQNGSNVRSADIRVSTFAPGSFTDDSNRYAQVGSVSTSTATAVQISYNSATHVLTAGFDGNGATGGYSFTSIPTLTADASTWGMTGADTFSIYVLGNSGLDGGAGVGPTLGLGGATMDNLSGSGLTAVPEPSTYAAIAGVAALGLAAWRRRRSATAA